MRIQAPSPVGFTKLGEMSQESVHGMMRTSDTRDAEISQMSVNRGRGAESAWERFWNTKGSKLLVGLLVFMIVIDLILWILSKRGGGGDGPGKTDGSGGDSSLKSTPKGGSQSISNHSALMQTCFKTPTVFFTRPFFRPRVTVL